jgi:hypothetical protein
LLVFGVSGNRLTPHSAGHSIPKSLRSARQGRSGSRSQSAAANNASKSSGHHRTNNACLRTPHKVEANRIFQTRSSPAVLALDPILRSGFRARLPLHVAWIVLASSS